MIRHNRDPNNEAARYRVKRNDDGSFELHTTVQGTFLNHNARRTGAYLSFIAIPEIARRVINEKESAYDEVNLQIENMTIGVKGDEGWFSSLADDCFFVIDGENLRYVPLTELRIITIEQFHADQAFFAACQGKDFIAEAQPDKSQVLPLAIGRINHFEELDRNNPETLGCTIGLASEHFQKLLDDCINRRISKVRLDGAGVAMSVALAWETPRELIFCAGEGIDISIDRVIFDYFV